MNIHEVFQHQVDNTRLIEKEDLENNVGIPLVWNGVIFRLPHGNKYTSKKLMLEGQKLLAGYVTYNSQVPHPILIEESELEEYGNKYKVIRVVDNIPILSLISDETDQY
jgi:hypothetical protein